MRETWALVQPSTDPETGYVDDVREWVGPLPDSCPPGWVVWYAADCDDIRQHRDDRWVKRWRPSIHMPRWASRITLEITGVRVERLQEITEADAIAEGLDSHPCFARPGKMLYRDYALRAYDPFEWYASPVDSYRSLWGSINGDGAWDANPWVWVVVFRQVPEAGA